MALYDLSQPLESGMPVYPGSDAVVVEQISTVEEGARVTALKLDTHVGTHLDAPSHVLPDGDALDAFDVSAFVFDALRIDCTHLGPREPITVEDLSAAGDPAAADDVSAADGHDRPEVNDYDLLAIRTGWDDRWGQSSYRDHPYLTPTAAAWCADRGCSVALDAFSPDPTPSADPDREREGEPDGHPAHEELLGGERFVVENLTGLDALPRTFTLSTFPLSIPGADGAPVRAVAEV
ncbi:MAG: cyclase family protein [Haloarculaceae archaeon]